MKIKIVACDVKSRVVKLISETIRMILNQLVQFDFYEYNGPNKGRLLWRSTLVKI